MEKSESWFGYKLGILCSAIRDIVDWVSNLGLISISLILTLISFGQCVYLILEVSCIVYVYI